MSTRDKHARKRPRRPAGATKPSRGSAARRRWHKRLWDLITNLLGSTKRAIITVGGLAGAVIAIVTVVSMILPKGPAPKPAVEASFPEAKVEPDIVLAQYEYNNQPASSTNASDRGQPQIRYRLAADASSVANASTVTDASTVTSTTGEPGNGTQTTGTEIVKETPGEAEAKLIKEKEEKAAREKAIEEEERRKREALKEKEAAKKAKEEAEAKEEAKLRVKEEAALRREEEAEEKTTPSVKGKQAHGNSEGDHQGASETQAGVEPAAPAKSFHKEGAAKVVVGTGAPTQVVDAVLRKARAILRKRAARLSQAYGRRDASFEGNEPALGYIGASDLAPRPPDQALIATSEGDGATLANSVPSNCGAGCALAPTVDKALADYSSNLAQAARVVAAAFSESRVELYEAKPQPVGVTVDYTIHFVGYKGQLMKLEWTLYKSGRPLPKTWWRKVVVKQIVPSGESIGVSGNFWAPVPPRLGHYYFSLRVLDGSAEPTHRTSESFR
jgi:hypothetical protein